MEYVIVFGDRGFWAPLI